MKSLAKLGIALSFTIVALGYSMVIISVINLNISKRLERIA